MMLRSAASATSAATRAASFCRPVTAAAPRGLSALVSMREEYPGVPATMPADMSPAVSKTSTLSNGAKVVTLENSHTSSAVGIVVGSGSRDESNAQQGASVLLESMAFKATHDRSSIRLQRDVELSGGTLTAIGGRDSMTYMADCPPEAAEVVLDSIAATVVKPKMVAEWELEDAREKVNTVTLRLHAESTEAQVMESLYGAAYGEANTLGKPMYSPCSLSAPGLSEFHATRYKASAMTVLGVNVPHDELKAMAESALADADSSAAPARPAAQYLGGEARIRAEMAMTSVALAYAAPSSSDADAPAYEVLATLLDIRAKAIAPSATGFANMHSDGGLVGVAGTAMSAEAGELTRCLVSCLKDLASGPSAAELEAAIVTAKIARGLTMESPTSALQAMAFGTVDASGLDGVTAASVKAAAAVACKTGLTVASVGNVGEVPLKMDVISML